MFQVMELVAGVLGMNDLTTPGVEPGLSRPQRDVLTTRRCGPCSMPPLLPCPSWIEPMSALHAWGRHGGARVPRTAAMVCLLLSWSFWHAWAHPRCASRMRRRHHIDTRSAKLCTVRQRAPPMARNTHRGARTHDHKVKSLAL